MVPSQLKLIIFDLDDTLAPAEANYDLAMQEIGIDPKGEAFLKARKTVKDRLPALAPAARSRFLYLKTYLEQTNQYSPQKSLELAEAYESSVARRMGSDWHRLNRDQLFRQIRSRGYRLAILSNETTRMQTRKLAAFEAHEKHFDLLLTSEERGMEKPQPALFLEMLQRFHVSAPEALMIGDSYENDIEPCVKLGIPCLHTLEFKTSTRKHNRTLDQLDQILNHLI
jgi:putative hydrolase of the HAD superfamily